MAGHVQDSVFDVQILILHVVLAIKNVSQNQEYDRQRYRPSLQHFFSLISSIVTFDGRIEIASKRAENQSWQSFRKAGRKSKGVVETYQRWISIASKI
jgi:hypothetical protein